MIRLHFKEVPNAIEVNRFLLCLSGPGKLLLEVRFLSVFEVTVVLKSPRQ